MRAEKEKKTKEDRRRGNKEGNRKAQYGRKGRKGRKRTERKKRRGKLKGTKKEGREENSQPS
jgi:hypothetical protein